MLAIRAKEALLKAIARGLPAGGRFAFTLEGGVPLPESERAHMPAANTVWLTPLDEMHTLLARAGLAVRWEDDWSESHREVAAALTDAYAADSAAIASRIGRRALEELLAGHRLWTEWLGAGRVRKFGLVAEWPAEGALLAGCGPGSDSLAIVIAEAVAAVTLTRGPVAESVTPRSAIISFRTSARDYGSVLLQNGARIDAGTGVSHVARLTRLTPGEHYEYTV